MKPAHYTLKSAARRGIRELRQELGTSRPLGEVLTQDPAAVAQIEQRFGPNAVQKIMSGRDVSEVGRALGSGSEGVAYPALGRQGPGVLKIHDPTAPLYSPDVIAGKRQFIGHDNPNLAQIHYETAPRQIRGMQAPAFMHEYVPGRELNPRLPQDVAAAHQFEQGVKNYARAGHSPIDVNLHNLKQTPSGQIKSFDFMAAPTSQLVPGGRRAGALVENFREGINAPYLQNVNELKFQNPMLLKNEAARHGMSYGDYLIRGGKGPAGRGAIPAAQASASQLTTALGHAPAATAVRRIQPALAHEATALAQSGSLSRAAQAIAPRLLKRAV
jgi:hypothetical protein